jgi:DNA-binding IclR family transcriptional regulator
MNEYNSNSNPDSFVDRIASVLVCLSEGINTVTDISKYCNLNMSTTHRLLNILKKPLFTVYDPEGHRYYLGPLITKLSSKPIPTHQYLHFGSLSEMRRLSDISQETISLDMVMGIQFIHVHDIPSRYGLKVLQDTTEIQPIEPLGAAQKVLLAQLEDREIKLALRVAAVWRSQDPPISESGFIEGLKQIRQQGYAVTFGEGILGSLGISAPVTNYNCPVALTILGPENRVKGRLPELTHELVKSARNLSQTIAELAAL